MAMTLEEMELESAELIPAREVMCAAYCHPGKSGGSVWFNSGQTNNGSGNDVTQFGLINLNDTLNNVSVRL